MSTKGAESDSVGAWTRISIRVMLVSLEKLMASSDTMEPPDRLSAPRQLMLRPEAVVFRARVWPQLNEVLKVAAAWALPASMDAARTRPRIVINRMESPC